MTAHKIFSRAIVTMAVAAGLTVAATVKSAFITIVETAEIKATPDKVWGKLISPEGVAILLDMQNPVGSKSMGNVGAFLSGPAMGDKGQVVVTYAKKDSELRLSFEPEQGHYVCHATVKLAKTANGTTITFSDGYSDDKAESVDKVASESAIHIAGSLKKFVEFAAK